uniref:Leucine-rich repeat-containing N-terminal plant-type domain-containing protein n=1 Tax=Paramoeba aestuarina TaxID=180227 RepID=A0A7S4NWN9_9EUKA
MCDVDQFSFAGSTFDCPLPDCCKYLPENECGENFCDTANAKTVLKTLYTSTNGPNWKNNKNWMDTSVSVCEWYGVICSSEVSKIHLASNQLSGSIPSKLGDI